MHKIFVVENKIELNFNQFLSLRHFYQIIIGVLPTNLYQILLDYSVLDQNQKIFLSFKTLMTLLNSHSNQILEAQKKLEAVGLIRTYYQKETNQIIFWLNKPLESINFVKNRLLYDQLIKKVDQDYIDKIVLNSQELTLDKDGYDEVTTKFQEMFTIESNYQKNDFSTLELVIPKIKNKEDAIKSLPSTQFVYYLTKKQTSPSLLRFIQDTQQLGFSHPTINLLIDYSFIVNSKIVVNHISKIANNFYYQQIWGFQIVKQELTNALNAKNLSFKIEESQSLKNQDQDNIKKLDDLFKELGDF